MALLESGVSAAEQKPTSLDHLKTLLSRVDGTCIELEKPSHDGRLIHIAARHVSNPFLTDSPAANRLFYGWDTSRRGSGGMTDVVIVDVYATGQDEPEAIGHMDWWLQGRYANGGGNMHSALLPTTDYEQAAFERWGADWDHIAFNLQADQHNQGIGSLMLAASGIALAGVGVDKFYSGALLDPAIKTYDRFGIHWPDGFPRLRRGDNRKLDITAMSIPIERLTANPYTDKALGEFIQA